MIKRQEEREKKFQEETQLVKKVLRKKPLYKKKEEEEKRKAKKDFDSKIKEMHDKQQDYKKLHDNNLIIEHQKKYVKAIKEKQGEVEKKLKDEFEKIQKKNKELNAKKVEIYGHGREKAGLLEVGGTNIFDEAALPKEDIKKEYDKYVKENFKPVPSQRKRLELENAMTDRNSTFSMQHGHLPMDGMLTKQNLVLISPKYLQRTNLKSEYRSKRPTSNPKSKIAASVIHENPTEELHTRFQMVEDEDSVELISN